MANPKAPVDVLIEQMTLRNQEKKTRLEFFEKHLDKLLSYAFRDWHLEEYRQTTRLRIPKDVLSECEELVGVHSRENLTPNARKLASTLMAIASWAGTGKYPKLPFTKKSLKRRVRTLRATAAFVDWLVCSFGKKLQLAVGLKELARRRKVEYLQKGEPLPVWVFINSDGTPLEQHNFRRRVYVGLLSKAELRHIRFHDLRHTFASLLLQQGESLTYVKEQMGHHSTQVTVDIYGHLIPGSNKQAVDRLDYAPVAATATA